MKKIFNVLAFAIVAIFFNSCEKNSAPVEPKTYTVSFAASGDISFSMSPMTKSDISEGDLLGITAYVSSDGVTYLPYAYGLFDDITKASIELVEGKVYKFTALYAKDGVNKLHYNYDDYYLNYHSLVTNKFNITSQEAYFERSTQDRMPKPVEFYYGFITGVVPSENLTVTIDLKAIYSGMVFNVDWDESITEGSVDVTFNNISPLSIKVEYPETSYSTIVSFPNVHVRNIYDGYFRSNGVGTGMSDPGIYSAYYTKADGSKISLIDRFPIPFELKTITTVNLKVKASTSDASIGINVESVELANGETVNIDATTDSDDAQIGTN